MSVTAESGYRKGLVDLSNGQVSREIFVNEEIYREEQERLFARAWLFVGHESQIPNPGDFFVSGMGEESVILCRDRAGEIHVFLNSCRHRGMKVCRYDEGNTPIFTCPYHGWSYGADGKLVGVPYFREAYHSQLDRSQWGLVEVAQLCNYKGAVWATWDPAAPSFSRISRRVRALSRPDLGNLGGRRKRRRSPRRRAEMADPVQLEIPGRKLLRRQLPQHQPPLGRSGRHRAIGQRAARHAGAADGAPAAGIALRTRPPDRTSMSCRRVSRPRRPTPIRRSSPNISRIAKSSGAGAKANGARVIGSPGEVFPNIALHPRQPRTIAVWHPRGAHQTECWRWYFVDKAAPQQVKDFLRDYYIRYSGPAGMTEQDDMENWNYAHAASRGTIARRYPYSYEQGQGYEIDGLRMAGTAHPRHGDGHHRGQVERTQSAQSVPPLGGIHGSRQLGRARDLAPGRPWHRPGRRMSEIVNTRQLTPGMQITLVDGAVAEVVSNPLDGVWVFARYLSSPTDPSVVGSEDMIFAQDIAEIRAPHN